MSNTETMEDNGITKVMYNHDKAASPEVATTPSNAYINHGRTKREVEETKRTNLKEPEMFQIPKQQIDRMETDQTCVTFRRVDHAKPIADESVQMHSRQADKTKVVEPKRIRYRSLVIQPRYLRQYFQKKG